MNPKEFAEKYFQSAKILYFDINRFSEDEVVVVNVQAKDSEGEWLEIQIPGDLETAWEEMITIETDREVITL